VGIASAVARPPPVDMTSKFLENVPVVKSRPNGIPRSGTFMEHESWGK
jgi:primosomal replication protein N